MVVFSDRLNSVLLGLVEGVEGHGRRFVTGCECKATTAPEIVNIIVGCYLVLVITDRTTFFFCCWSHLEAKISHGKCRRMCVHDSRERTRFSGDEAFIPWMHARTHTCFVHTHNRQESLPRRPFSRRLSPLVTKDRKFRWKTGRHPLVSKKTPPSLWQQCPSGILFPKVWRSNIKAKGGLLCCPHWQSQKS